MAKDRRCLDDQSWEVAAMASAETVMAVYSDREDKVLESRMRSKDSCPVWREGAGKVPDGNSPTPYSTSRPVLGGRRGASPPPLLDSLLSARRVKRPKRPWPWQTGSYARRSGSASIRRRPGSSMRTCWSMRFLHGPCAIEELSPAM